MSRAIAVVVYLSVRVPFSKKAPAKQHHSVRILAGVVMVRLISYWTEGAKDDEHECQPPRASNLFSGGTMRSPKRIL